MMSAPSSVHCVNHGATFQPFELITVPDWNRQNWHKSLVHANTDHRSNPDMSSNKWCVAV